MLFCNEKYWPPGMDMKTNDIKYKEILPEINEYWDLFGTTGWNDSYHFTVNELENAIKNSWHALSVFDTDNLIGFGRVISDGIHHAFIVDLIIHPGYQGKGIGSALLSMLIKKCTDQHIRDIQLFSAMGKSEFYEKFNFIKREENAPGMQYKY